jgi:7-carboxy-7-deazaguanine synthase
MGYAVKEIFYTLQGEGAQAGRAAVFCRFAGCNLWSGREADRAAAVCKFCDTDFVGVDGDGGGKFETASALAAAVEQKWAGDSRQGKRFVVCTGGEPLLQLDAKLIDARLREPQGWCSTGAAQRRRVEAGLSAGWVRSKRV